MKVIRENGVIRVEEGDKTRVAVLKAFRNRFNVVLLRRGDAFFSVLYNHFAAATGRPPRVDERFEVVFTHTAQGVGRIPRGDISFSANFIHATVAVGMGPRGDVEFSLTFTHDTAGAGRPPRELLAFVSDYGHAIKAAGSVPRFVVAFAGLFTHEALGVGRMPRTVLHFDADFSHAIKGVGIAPGAATWTPADLASLVFWIDPSEAATVTTASGLITQINDKSSGGFNVAQPVGSRQPAYTTAGINGLNVATWTNDALAASGPLPISTKVSVFAITNAAAENKRLVDQRGTGATSGAFPGFQFKISTNSVDAPWLVQQGANEFIHATFATTFTGVNLVMGQSDLANLPASHLVFLNGVDDRASFVQGFSLPTDITTTQPFTIGANSNGQTTQYLDGSTGDIIVCNDVLSLSDRQKMEGYLAHKWGIASKLPAGHPYINNPPAS